MALRIHLVASQHDRTCVDRFAELARRDRFRQHQLTDHVDDADVLLFPDAHLYDHDWRQARIRKHALLRSHADRAYVYNERDNPWCSWPGLYVSYPNSSFRWSSQRPVAYYRIDDEGLDRAHDPGLLFSLMATPTHPCRIPLYQLAHPDAHVERTDGFVFYDSSSSEFHERRARFRRVLADSMFVLCPRGGGASSIRLYETLAAGRVPVVISDEWTPPVGPDWDSCSVRWPEGRTEGLVEHLESLRNGAAVMGLAARAIFETWFSPDVAFHRLASSLEDLHRTLPAGGHRAVHDRRWLQVSRSTARVSAGRWRRTAVGHIRRS